MRFHLRSLGKWDYWAIFYQEGDGDCDCEKGNLIVSQRIMGGGAGGSSTIIGFSKDSFKLIDGL